MRFSSCTLHHAVRLTLVWFDLVKTNKRACWAVSVLHKKKKETDNDMTMTSECIVEGAEEVIFLSFRYFCIHSPIKYSMDQINHLLEAGLEYNGGPHRRLVLLCLVPPFFEINTHGRSAASSFCFDPICSILRFLLLLTSLALSSTPAILLFDCSIPCYISHIHTSTLPRTHLHIRTLIYQHQIYST